MLKLNLQDNLLRTVCQ